MPNAQQTNQGRTFHVLDSQISTRFARALFVALGLQMEQATPELLTRGSPRLRGVCEHLERARFLFDLSAQQADSKSKYRLMLSAVYACRAITELMLEAAEKQEIENLNDPDPRQNRGALEGRLAPKLPYYTLIERIRIHDFHRFGIVAPDPTRNELMFGGPIKLTAQRGLASVSVPATGPHIATSGNSSVKMQRPLLVQDGEFFDEESSKFVALEKILSAFLTEAPNVVSEFKQLIKS